MKIVLIEADFLDINGDVQTMYLANAPYASQANDMPAHQPYDDYIIGGMRVNTKMNEVLLGATSISSSNIEIINLIGDTANENFAGQQVRIYRGEQSAPKAEFTQIYTAVIDDLIVKDATRLSLVIKSHNEKMTEPLQQIVVGDSGNKAPIAYGQCFNVKPVVSNKNIFEYCVNETALTSITQVRKSGIAIARNDNTANGKFSFSTSQGGTITADITAPLATAKAIILDICSRVDITDIDNASLDLLPLDEISMYISKGESANAALDAIVNSFGFFWYFKRNGQFAVGKFALGQAPTAVIYPDEIQRNGMKVIKTIKPAKDIKLTYSTNWTPQESSLDDAVTTADKEKYARDGDMLTATNINITTQYPNAQTRKPQVLIKNAVPGQVEADRRAALLNKPRRIYQIKGFSVPFSYELGQTITVIYPFLDFSQGKDAIIVGITDDALKSFSTIEVFC